jgi:PadR family transcriptional regulator, regulatory protein PadR
MAMRLTVQVQPILQALLRDPTKERYGLEFSEEAGLQPRTAYPILLRLEHEGWVSSRCEDVGPASGEAPCSPLLPGDGRRRGTGQRGPRGGMAPQRPNDATLRRLAERGGLA